MCGNSAHISRRLGSIRTLTLESHRHDRRHRVVRRRASGQSALYSVLPAHFPSRRLSTVLSFVDCLSRISRPTCLPALWMGMSPKHYATTKPTALLLQKLVKTFPRVVCLILG